MPSVDETACPPLHVIIYAIRNILFPTLLHSEIRDLLTLLAHAERVRQKANTEIDRYEDPGDFLEEDEEVRASSPSKAPGRVKSGLEGTMRAMYREIVIGFSLVVSCSTPHPILRQMHAVHRTYTRRGSHQRVPQLKS